MLYNASENVEHQLFYAMFGLETSCFCCSETYLCQFQESNLSFAAVLFIVLLI